MKKPLTCFLIFLAISAFVAQLIPNTLSQTQSIKVIGYTYYIDSLGYLVVVGEVQNQGLNIIDSVTLTGVITDLNGAQFNSYTYVWARYILPQQKAPFYMEFTAQNQDGASVGNVETVKIDVYSAPAVSQYQYQGLTIVSSQAYIGTNPGSPATGDQPSDGDKGVFWVTGKLKNTGSESAQKVIVYGTFYNAAGLPVAVGYSATSNQVAASQTIDFKLGAFDLNQSIVPADKKISTYSLLIQAEGPLKEGDAPIPVATPTPDPILTSAPTPAQGSSPDNGSDSFSTWIYVAVTAVVIVVVLGLLLFKKRSRPHPKALKKENKLRKTNK